VSGGVQIGWDSRYSNQVSNSLEVVRGKIIHNLGRWWFDGGL